MQKIFLTAAVLCLFGCVPKQFSVADISGTYKGMYMGGEETFDLLKDGTFTQSFIENGTTKYKSNGTWKIAEGRQSFINRFLSPGPSIVIFDHFYTMFDNFTGDSLASPKVLDGMEADWYPNIQRLSFWPSKAYVIDKQQIKKTASQ